MSHFSLDAWGHRGLAKNDGIPTDRQMFARIGVLRTVTSL